MYKAKIISKLTALGYLMFIIQIFRVDAYSFWYIATLLIEVALMGYIQFFAAPMHYSWTARYSILWKSKLYRTGYYGYLIHPYPIIAYYLVAIVLGGFDLWGGIIAAIIPVIRVWIKTGSDYEEALNIGSIVIGGLALASLQNDKTDAMILNQLNLHGYNATLLRARDISDVATKTGIKEDDFIAYISSIFSAFNIGNASFITWVGDHPLPIEYNKRFLKEMKEISSKTYMPII